jgi:hypothetical protein
VLDDELVGEIERLTEDFLSGRRPLFDDRIATERIVDGHGDLLAEDVFCLPDYPRVLDCIEFDDRLRWVDSLDDACFLAMDLEHLHRVDLAQRFLTWYLELSGSSAVASLQHHYVAYRAFVRAKVSCIRAAQGLHSAAADADTYARLALSHLRAGQPQLLLVGGAPGTGKTTLARAIAERQGWVALSSDEVRRQLPEKYQDRYSPEAKEATYHLLLQHARHALERGQCVVADATWGDPAMRTAAQDAAAVTASELVALECQAPVEVSSARAQRRLAAGRDASEAGADIARHLAAARGPWPEAITIATDTTPDDSLRKALTALAFGTL